MTEINLSASNLLRNALAQSGEERELLNWQLIESLDPDPSDSQADQLWPQEIARRIDDARAGRVGMIEGEEVRLRLAHRLLNGRSSLRDSKFGCCCRKGSNRVYPIRIAR